MADTAEPLTDRIGAANTLVFDSTGCTPGPYALNTDYASVLDALTEGLQCRREDLASRTCAVLGAGGAARAVVAGLVDCGCDVTVYNRTEERARDLAEEFGCKWRPFEQRKEIDMDVVVNATAIGMSPNVDVSPLPAESLRPGMMIFDTVYNPLETLLVRDAIQAGCRTITGLEMFVRQAAMQFEAWTDRPAPRDLMRDVVVERLRPR
jgi:3-dehydroquinate dehydratase/shikimate dehydrogenase